MVGKLADHGNSLRTICSKSFEAKVLFHTAQKLVQRLGDVPTMVRLILIQPFEVKRSTKFGVMLLRCTVLTV